MSHFSTDDIAFELLILKQLASQRRSFGQGNSLSEPHVACLRASSLWVPPVLTTPERSTPVWKAAALAGLIALAPLGWLPVYADSTLSVGMSVIDARTGKPLTDARVLNEHGTLLGTTGQDGKLVLNVPLSSTQRLVIEKPGYRSFPVIRTQLRDNNLIAMIPSQAATPVAATPAPVATPKAAATPRVDHPATPMPTPVATPKPTPKPMPAATPKPTPKPIPAATSKPTPTSKPAATPHAEATPAAPSRRAARPERQAMGERYVVRHGDTLWGIAKREYGDPTRWKILFEVNHPPIRKAHLLQPGMILKMPKLAEVATGAKGHVVVVKAGDSLWLIAEHQLGDGERWREIYRLNRSQVHNPRLIYPRQRLQIPRK